MKADADSSVELLGECGRLVAIPGQSILVSVSWIATVATEVKYVVTSVVSRQPRLLPLLVVLQRKSCVQPAEDRLVKQTHCAHMAVLAGAFGIPHHNMFARSL